MGHQRCRLFRHAGAAFLAAVFALQPAIATASADQSAGGANAGGASGAAAALGRDFSGIWTPDQGVLFTDPTKGVASGRNPGFDDTINPPPLTPEYAEMYAKTKAARAAGQVVADPTGMCLPPGMPRLMANPYPFEILHTPGRVTLIFTADSHTRRIFTDGRGHPEDLDPTFNGHSIGRWEGDTLVVETIGLRDDTDLQSTGLPKSGELRVIERIRLIGPNKLENEITMIDPIAFTAPFKATRTWTRIEDEEIQEYVCLDNNRSFSSASK
jgi:hypothetical protein